VVASRTSSVSCGAPGTSFAAVRRIFFISSIRLTLVCIRPAVSGNHGIVSPRLGGANRVVEYGRWVRAWVPGDDLEAGALAPNLELLGGGSTKGVRGGEKHLSAITVQTPAELCNGGRLARPFVPRQG